ncbi:MAG: hypothetical protein MO853_11820 [Candidatus Protistobacter heckmanni]|nr:hypothetical protein [Candidatus Protistobacter heckmanni]
MTGTQDMDAAGEMVALLGQDGGAPAIAAPDAHQATALPQALSQTLQQTAPKAAASSGAFAA